MRRILLAPALALVLLFPATGALGEKQEIRIASHSHFVDGDGLLHVVGEVENSLNVAAGNIRIYATFYDLKGDDVVAIKAANAFIGDLRPREKSPFSVIVADTGDAGKIASYRLSAISANQSVPILEPYLKVAASVPGHVDDKGAYRLAGQVVNYGEDEASSIIVAASFYNASNHVVYAAYKHYSARLSPTETLPFEFGVDKTNATAITSASVNARSSQYSSILAGMKDPAKYSVSLAIDSASYSSGQDIVVRGKVAPLAGAKADYADPAIVEIRKSDRTLYDLAEAAMSPDGSFETSIEFYALPEHAGQTFIIKAVYGRAFAETTFVCVQIDSSNN